MRSAALGMFGDVPIPVLETPLVWWVCIFVLLPLHSGDAGGDLQMIALETASRVHPKHLRHLLTSLAALHTDKSLVLSVVIASDVELPHSEARGIWPSPSRFQLRTSKSPGLTQGDPLLDAVLQGS
jgi:predicted secreted protein